VVVRDARDTERLSLDRYELMRSGLKDNQPLPSTLVPVNESPTLPAPPPPKAAATPTPAPNTAPLITPATK
jgi:general secretion pathway protein D